MKIFLIGASGFIGGHLVKSFSAAGWEVNGSCFRHREEGLVQLDITDRQRLLRVLKEYSPEVVCLPAAIPNVEYCEGHPSETDRTNVEGTRNVAHACKEIGARLVFFSSDYVFDGEDGPYSEDAPPNPISVYGRQKLAGERIVRKLLDDWLITRVTVVYGVERSGKNFVARLIKSLEKRREVKAPIDQVGSPTYAENLSEMVRALVEKGVGGVFNVCGPKLMDRFTFACLAAEVFGLDPSGIRPVTTAELGQKARRPLRAGMETAKIEQTVDVRPLGPEEGLMAMKERM